MITASIVVYCNKAADLVRVLRSTLASPIDIVYLIDHSPADEVKRFMDSPANQAEEHLSLLMRDGRVVYEPHPNRGFGAGHNIAIRKSMAAGAAYHAILNPDIYWSDPVIESLVKHMDSHPEVGMMTPKVLFPDGRLQYNCKLLPTPMDLIGRRFLPKKWMKKRNERFELHSSGYDHIMNVPYIHGCFMLFRNETLRQVGLDPEDKRRIKKYSLGMRKRLLIAQAIMEAPDILVLDEPTNSLDAGGVDMLYKVVEDAKKRGATVFVASHYKEDIETLCDVTYEMKEGQLQPLH